MAYGICLIIQQIVLLLGIVKFPLINLCQVFNRGIGANSLSFEPSTAARTMVVLYLSLLRLFQIEHDRLPKVKELFYKYRWPSILFLWSMLTMGSGTAFVCLAILSLLFIKRQYVYSILPLLIVVYMTVSKIDYEPAQRAIKSIDAFLSLDKRNVINADYSAAARITPLLNTLNLDFFDYKSWIGQGSGFADGFSYSKLLNTAVVGRIHEYGIINFILMQILVYTCAIRRFCSMETLFWIFILGMTLNNVAYVWGIIMVMTVVSYFQQQKECNQLVFDEDEETKTEEYDLSLEPAAC
jgi:hypothetical protein